MPKVSSDMEAPKALNYIEKLVAKLCPDGVEYVELGGVTVIKRGKSLTKKNTLPGNIPVIAGGRSPAYYHSTSNRQGPVIVVAGSGAYAGYVSYWESDIYASDAFSVKPKDSDLASIKYIYYFLSSKQNKLYRLQSGSGVPHVYPRDFNKLIIPFPPLEVQNAIVEILDKFTELEAELEAELAARRAQYEYYRKLLLEDITNRVSVERVELSEIFDISNGYTPKKSVSSYWDDGNVPWFRMEDIRRNGRVLSESLIKVHESAVKKSGLFPENSIIVATSATIGEHALIKIPFLCNQRFTALILKEKYINKLDRKFLFYYCFVLDEWCRNNTTQSSFASVDMKGFRKFVFPVPSLTDQERIVSILDTFDALVNDISSGLPAELEARRKQYEYYRDRLLTFPRKPESAVQAMQR